MREIEYSKIRSKLQTGDLVGFNGKGLISGGIKWASRGNYNHIGMVVRKEDLSLDIANYRDGSVLLFESTTLGNTKDILKNKYVKGVQLVYLSDKIKNYKGDVFIRRLVLNRNTDFIIKLNEFILRHIHKPYERSFFELILCCVNFINPKEDLSSLFCSELVAEFLQEIKEIPNKLKSNSFSPHDLFNYSFKLAYDIVKIVN